MSSVEDSRFRVQGSGFRVQGSGFRVKDVYLRPCREDVWRKARESGDPCLLVVRTRPIQDSDEARESASVREKKGTRAHAVSLS